MYNPQITYSRIKDRAGEIKVEMKELNEACSLSDNAISSAKKSRDGMKAKNLYAISECLDCSVDYLLGRTDNPQSHKTAVIYGDLLNNSGIVGNVGSTINGSAVDPQLTEFLEAFSKLSYSEKAKVILYADEFIKK